MAGMLAMAATTACTTDLDEVQLNPSEVVPPVLTVPATIDLGAMASTMEFDYTPIDYGFSRQLFAHDLDREPRDPNIHSHGHRR